MEAVSGEGYSSAARVRKILEGGLIDRWNRMQEENGLHGWGVQVDDVIIGMSLSSNNTQLLRFRGFLSFLSVVV